MKRLMFSLLFLLIAVPSWANPPCGSVLPAGVTTLTSNQSCPAQGYIMSSGAILDCVNFAIIGPDIPPASCNPIVPGCQTGHYGVRVDNQTGVLVKRCTITHFERGIYATNVTNSTFKKNTLRDNTRYGMMLSGSLTSNVLSQNNKFIANRDEGVHISDLVALGNLSSFDTASSNVAEGFYLLNADGLTVQDCSTNDNGSPGIYLKNSKDVSIARCTLLNDNIQILNDTGLPWVVNGIEMAP